VASIEKRVSKSGVVTWRVAWREGGRRTGRRDGETCDYYDVARKFRALVEAANEHRPEGYPQGCRGVRPAPAEPVPDPAVLTFGALFAEYLGWLSKHRKAEERQIEDYRRLFEQHVRAAVVTLPDGSKAGPLGGLPIDQYTTEVDEAWVTRMAERTYVRRKARKDGEEDDVRPYSAKTIHNIHGAVISPAFAYAARRYSKHVPINPCVSVVLPKKSSGKSVSLEQVPTGAEIERWITFGYEVSTLAGDIITLAVGTGMRWSEMIALRPCDIDLERGLLTVAQVVKQDKRRRNYIAPYGKTDAALRTLRVSQSMVDMLSRRMRDVAPKDLIFQAARGTVTLTKPQRPSHIQQAIQLDQQT
jgi:integrase